MVVVVKAESCTSTGTVIENMEISQNAYICLWVRIYHQTLQFSLIHEYLHVAQHMK